MAAKVKILLAYASPGVTRARFGLTDMVIPYTIDETNRFEVRIPYEDYTSAKGEAAVRQAAQQQLALYNKEFTL